MFLNRYKHTIDRSLNLFGFSDWLHLTKESYEQLYKQIKTLPFWKTLLFIRFGIDAEKLLLEFGIQAFNDKEKISICSIFEVGVSKSCS